MKKFLCYVACALFVWGGLWPAIISQVSDTPKEQGIYAIVSAILFCAAILLSGYGNTLKWKKDEE